MKPKKPKPEPKRASPLAAEAIRQLAKTRRQQKVLQARAALLQKIIVAEGGGVTDEWQAYIQRKSAGVFYRTVRQKASVSVVLKPRRHD